MTRSFISLALAVATLGARAPGASAEVPREVPGIIEKLPAPRPHWIWVSDLVLERTALIDADSGKYLGQINGGYGAIAMLFPKTRHEAYLPATFFSRRTHGERTDILEVYDLTTLAPVAEVKMTGKRAIDAVALAHSALSDDDRFAAVFNWTPRTSLSIVDAEQRAFKGEIEIPGCSLVYTAGARRFFSLCTDGSALVVTIDDLGREVKKERTKSFFDPKVDPITEKAVRLGDRWFFVSFDGWVYPINVGGAEITFDEKWSLLEQGDRDQKWRIGGWQHLAVHRASGRLYSLVHRGGPDTHKDPGEEVWVYDLATRKRIQRIKMKFPGATVYGFPVEVPATWPGPVRSLVDWLIDRFAPPTVGYIQVTQDERPLLVTASQFAGALGIYDARTGTWVRRVLPTGWTTDLLLAPWGDEAR